MKRSKKEIPVAQRFTAYLVFSLIDGSSNSSPSPSAEELCRLEFDICAGEKCPKATENFRQLISGAVTVGEKRNSRQATYKGTTVLRTTNDIVQLGDTANSADGKAQDTIYGALIEDEACGVIPHRFGTLTLCNSGPNSNGSQFAIVANEEVEALPHLDRRHVSLGFLKGGEAAQEQLLKLHEVCAGLVVDRTGKMPRPTETAGGMSVILSDCGVVAEQS